jgi:hypothetical protein
MGIIAGELDVQVPDIDFSDIEEFLKRTKDYHNSTVFSKEEKIYFERNKREYPWDRRVLEYNGTEFYDYQKNKPFNILSNLINTLPIDKKSRVVLLLSQSAQRDYDFNFHFDADLTHGFRICIGLDTTIPFLEIGELKPEFYHYSKNLNKIEDYMMSDKIYNIIPRRPNTVICLSGSKYPHRVPVNSSKNRFVLIVRGNVLSMDNVNFLQRITEC